MNENPPVANIPTRTNNPGDLKFIGQSGATQSPEGFAQFNNPQQGYAALLNDVQTKMKKNPQWTLADFSNTYAPSSDGNNSALYAAKLANQLGVSPATKISELQSRIGEFAEAIAANEGFAGAKPLTPQKRQAVPQEQPQQGEPSLGQKLSGRLQDLQQHYSEGVARTEAEPGIVGKVGSMTSQGIQEIGDVAGGVLDVAGASLNLIPGVKQIGQAIGGGIQQLAQTPTGQTIVNAANQIAEQHPVLANDVSALGNIVGVAGLVSGVGAIKNAAGSVAKRALTGATDDVLNMVSPALTARQTATAIAERGTKKVGALGKVVLNPDPRMQDVANAVRQNVPKFNPSKGLLYNVAVTDNAARQMAQDLASKVKQLGSGRLYTYQELGSYLNGLEKPISLTGENAIQYNRLVNAAMKIAQKAGGKVENLLDVRKEFDNLVRQTYPNLYKSDALTPLRVGIKNIRNGITRFTAAHLPEETGLRESLLTQSKLLTAIENMSAKAAKKGGGELGTTIIGRTAAKHPLITGAAKAVVRGGLLGTGIKGAETLIP